MKRSAVGKEFRSNFSLGGAVEKYELSAKETELAEKVAKVCGLDYCGVDIMKGPKSPSPTSAGASPFEERGTYREEDYDDYVLEVNRQCQFQGFEKSTGINVAKKVVEMFLEKGGQ
jgi:glutathione synthase/RimK-type ligase-like ATP-grasp enzyme